jgi:hypothetical protein
MNLELEPNAHTLSDAELLAILTERIEVMLEQETDLLMSLLYRLDVEEKAILQALHPDTDVSAAVALAKLVLERQKQRWSIKKNTVVGNEGIPDGWGW